jgi:nickel-dependent lactate racemase
LYTGEGLSGFSAALKQAAALSSKLHIRYLDEEKSVVVQRLPEMYDEVWTAGKGSYKLQKPGVLAPGGEIILFAPHIHCFHSNSTMDREIREIGYHGRDYVVDFCKRNPEFSKNVASHVINVRGLGSMVEGKEQFPFKVTLATQIPEADCTKVGLGYRDPESLREEDFSGPGKLWIPDGGQWLYARQSES